MRALLVPLIVVVSSLAALSVRAQAQGATNAGAQGAAQSPAPSSTATNAHSPAASSTATNAQPQSSAPATAPNAPSGAQPPATGSNLVLELQPGAAHPGDLVMITLRTQAPCPSAWLGDRALTFYEMPGGCRALVGLAVEQPAGPLDVRVASAAANGAEQTNGAERTNAAGAKAAPAPSSGATATGATPAAGASAPKGEVIGALEVLPPAFNVRELKVANKFVKPSAAQKKKMKDDQKAFDEAFSQPFGPPLFTHDFARPLPSVITAPFGDLRTFNGKKQSQHYGMDLDGKIGDPIHASNDGVVVMARPNFASGNTVILSHGGGLFTSYFHMTRMDVKVGQKVKQGDQLGIVGKTGRVTGPHLHFGCKVTGMWVDPASLLAKRFEIGTPTDGQSPTNSTKSE